ncbi:hypothetical protein D3C80_1446870 [compost metagenome]
MQITRVLAQDLHGHRTLPGDHVRVIEGWHEGSALLLGQLQGMGQCVGEALTVLHHVATPRTHTFDLQRRRGGWHDDGGFQAQVRSCQGDALGVVARRRGDHPAFTLGRCQTRQPRVGTADLERERGLQVFTLEQHLVAKAGRQRWRWLQRCFDGQVVDGRRENAPHLLRQ